MISSALPVHKLVFNDTIGLFSPSSPLTNERQERMLESIRFLESKYKIVWAKHAFDSNNYQAGTREDRLEDLVSLLSIKEIKALLATWGGKNANQLVNGLPYQLFRERRIPIIGFSDTGVILNPISVNSNIITFYGPNIAGKILESQHSDLSNLSGEGYEPFGESLQESWKTINAGNVEGILYGGNLSTFTIGLSGHSCLNKMKDVVFFWESANDPPQIIDQYLAGLENSGFFDSIKAMIVGQAFYKHAPIDEKQLLNLLREVSIRHHIPVIKVNTFGHYNAENPLIPIGAAVSIDTSEKTIKLLNSVVF